MNHTLVTLYVPAKPLRQEVERAKDKSGVGARGMEAIGSQDEIKSVQPGSSQGLMDACCGDSTVGQVCGNDRQKSFRLEATDWLRSLCAIYLLLWCFIYLHLLFLKQLDNAH